MVYYQKVIKTLFVFIKTGLKLNTGARNKNVQCTLYWQWFYFDVSLIKLTSIFSLKSIN